MSTSTPNNPPEAGTSAPASDRKTAILQAALAVFTEKGVADTTIDDIRVRSQASVGSIYHHFGTKEGIAAALFTHGLDDYWGQLISSVQAAPNAERAIHAMLTAHIGWIMAQPELARFLFARRQAVSAAHDQSIRERSGEHFKNLFALMKPWFASGILRRMPPDLYAPLLVGPAQEYARQWLSGRTTLAPEIAIQELSAAAWRSMANDPGRSS